MDQEHMSISEYADAFMSANPDLTEMYKVHEFVMTYEHGVQKNTTRIYIVVREYFGSGVHMPFRSSIDGRRTKKNGGPWSLTGAGNNIETALSDIFDKIRINLQSGDEISNTPYFE